VENAGIVVIGQNEGSYLEACFKSIVNSGCPVVYSDSASKDNSIEIAEKFNIEIVQLDAAKVSAACGRNLGAKYLLDRFPNLKYIQFIDGDTALDERWMANAIKVFYEQPDVALVAGQLDEKNSTKSLYKEMSALEWERAPGETLYSGGNCMIRSDVFVKIGGFNPKIIAGEDPELCYRLRKEGWKIWQINTLMGVHDSKILTFSQFLKRSMRTGYAYQQISCMYCKTDEKLFFKENLSNWFYGGLIPLLTLLLVPIFSFWSLGILLIYPLLIMRIFWRKKKYWKPHLAFFYALTCTAAKFPGVLGACRYLFTLTNKM
jgi:GT2 family glycosyltransferase